MTEIDGKQHSASGDVAAADPYPRRRVPVLDSEMAFVDTGEGDPVVFLHGNPTSSYLWRNVIPHVATTARCLAPDLIGMGESGRLSGSSYWFADHARYLDVWFDTLNLTDNVTLVLHDWGTGLGFDWARRHPGRVRGLAYLEGIVRPLTWEQWPEAARGIFQGMRGPAGDGLVLEKNAFIERILPSSVMRELRPEEMEVYRRPFQEAGETRRPMLTWPRELPIEGQPPEMVALVEEYSTWLASSTLPKLFINGEPGSILTGEQREFCRTWLNQQEVTVRGKHFLQEDSPHEIGHAVATWLAGL